MKQKRHTIEEIIRILREADAGNWPEEAKNDASAPILTLAEKKAGARGDNTKESIRSSLINSGAAKS